MSIRFGTDGVRGVANRGLTPEHALALGRAAASRFGGPIAIGRDTRRSGPMLAGALASGIASGGARVLDLGVVPTPAVAALAPRLGAAAGGVVSASHNPFPDNGIKFFSGEGRKLAEDDEAELERLANQPTGDLPTGEGVGDVEPVEWATRLYAEGALEGLRPDATGMRVLLDCANGAAYQAAPMAFEELGAKVSVVGDRPTGTNINDGVGSTHVQRLDVSGNDVAFAFDGDADRVLAVDESGGVVDGDRIIAILARDLMERDLLAGGVVVTVMSNLGFFRAMDGLGIPYEVTPVGDRHVAAAMERSGAAVGGEQSGHVILARHVTTGDGLVTALAVLDVMARTGKPLSELAAVMEVYPQELINVPVDDPASAKRAAGAPEVERAVAEAERKLGTDGRILLRPSGTEPKVRVMVEHLDERICAQVCREVARVVEDAGNEVTA